jgi:nicotine oxidoreductase
VRFYSSECQTNKLESALNKLRKEAAKFPNNRINSNLYKFLYNKEIYMMAYNKLKSNPGNMTPALSPETLDGLSDESFDEIINSMKNRSFKFKPMRRIMIEKKSGGERPLTIAGPRDKIVLECIRIILEIIFEPTFEEHSHGFRYGKSCHTCLNSFVENNKTSK